MQKRIAGMLKANKAVVLFILIAAFILPFSNVKESKDILIPVVLLVIMVCLSSLCSLKKKSLLEPVTIINFFVVMIFIIRPIELIYFPPDLSTMHVLQIYDNFYGTGGLEILPHLKAISTAVFGLAFFYAGYYSIENTCVKAPRKIPQIEIGRSKRWCYVFLFLSLVICVIFFYKYSYFDILFSSGSNYSNVSDFGMIDISWSHLLMCVIIYLFCLSEKNTMLITFLVMLYSILILAFAKRAFLVNLLLCFTVLLYYKSKKRSTKKVVLLAVFIALGVVFLGTIRSNNISRDVAGNFFLKLTEEFNMYDMFLVSLDFEQRFGRIFFGGLSYISGFLKFLPDFIWPDRPNFFDHEFTAMLFQETYNGAVPSSLFGSLYLNLSLVGMGVFLFLLGLLFKYVYIRLVERPRSQFAIGYYAIFTTFVYDIMRVGDVSREFWWWLFLNGIFWAMGVFVNPYYRWGFLHRNLVEDNK